MLNNLIRFFHVDRGSGGDLGRLGSNMAPSMIQDAAAKWGKMPLVGRALLLIGCLLILGGPWMDAEAAPSIHLLRDDPGRVDFVADAIEVTQAVQDLNNSVPLVRDRRTFVRFHAHVDQGAHPAQATLRVQRGGQSAVLTPVNVNQVVLPTAPDRGVLDHSFLFELPDTFTQGEITLTAQVMPVAGAPEDGQPANNSVATTVAFESVPTVDLVLYRMGYALNGEEYWADAQDRDSLVDWLRRTYPVSDLRVWDRSLWLGEATVDENGVLTNPNCAQINSTLSSKKVWDTAYGSGGVPLDAHYYGLVDDGGGFLVGCALGSPFFVASGATGDSSWGWDTDGSYGDWYGAAQLAQSYGISSIGFCGAPANPDFPYAAGRISPSLSGPDALYGFDPGTGQVYSPNYKDLMSRCGYLWMSDVTYKGLMDRFQGDPLAAQPALGVDQSQTRSDRMLISGTINPISMSVTLNPFFVLPDVADVVRRIPGPYAIVLRDAQGAELARYAFTPLTTGVKDPTGKPVGVAEGAGNSENKSAPMTFTELVPFVPGTATVQILVPDSATVAGVTASPGQPSVQILAPGSGQPLLGPKVSVNWTGLDADGETLTYNVQYSPDGGASWEMVAQGIRGESVEIETSNLTGGQDGRFRVWATDGIHSIFVDSSPVNMPNRAPQLRLLSADAATVAAGQTVNLAVNGYDADTGPLFGSALDWVSDLDGPLGTGDNLSVQGLSPGNHTITVRSQDSQGADAEASIALTVVGDAGQLPPPPDTLQAGPPIVSVDMRSYGPYYISLSNANLGRSVNWTAVPNQTWIQLGKTSGTTPDIIPVSVNWTSVNWTSVNWTSVNWTSVNWTSVNWTSVNWTSVNWTGGAPRGEILGSITITSPDLGTSVEIPVEAVVDPFPHYLPLVEQGAVHD